MRYLVTGEYVEPGPLLSLDKVINNVEQMVTPTLEALEKLEKKGKVLAGGIHAGARAASMIIEAKNNEEVDELLGTLPLWGLLRWTVTPLVAFRDRAKWESQLAKEMKKKMGL